MGSSDFFAKIDGRLKISIKYLILVLGFAGLLVASLYTSRIWYDDTGHYRVAKQLTESGELCYPTHSDGEQCVEHSPFITAGPFVHHAMAKWMNIFGPEFYAARWMMVLFSMSFLVIFIVVSGRILGSRKAFWAALLIVGNIQLVTYGSQYLAEVPMLFWLFVGLMFQVKYLMSEKPNAVDAVGAAVFWGAAVLSKEYILGPITMALLLTAVFVIREQNPKVAGIFILQILIVTAYLALYWFFKFDGLDEWQAYMASRAPYRTEFLAFNWIETMGFLVFKPLIALGMTAHVIKVYFRRNRTDFFLLALQLSLFAMFVASQGYDRFGFLLIFLPAIYLSEFIVTLIDRYLNRGSIQTVKWMAFVAVFIALFSQRTIPVLVDRMIHPEAVNEGEKSVAEYLKSVDAPIYTYDEQVIPFLEDGAVYRVNDVIPAAAGQAPKLQLQPGELLVAGIYAETVFQQSIPWDQLEEVFATGQKKGEEGSYRVLKVVPE